MSRKDVSKTIRQILNPQSDNPELPKLVEFVRQMSNPYGMVARPDVNTKNTQQAPQVTPKENTGWESNNQW